MPKILKRCKCGAIGKFNYTLRHVKDRNGRIIKTYKYQRGECNTCRLRKRQGLPIIYVHGAQG
jgi:hypothetical protein